MNAIPYGKQNITSQDIEAVVEILKSDFLTQGPKVSEFEEKFAKYIGSKYAVAVCNGTGALHLSVLALGVSSGDKVITTPITFAASANCVKYCGGEVDFVDIDSNNYTIDLDKLEQKIKSAPKGAYKGIIPVDFAGYPCDMERIRELADEYGLWVIEDACHSPGGYFQNKSGEKVNCGDGQYADLSIFSFHPVKHIATGEGGMITTNNQKLYEKLLLLRTHGITKDANLLLQNDGGWYYEMQELGYNYRLSDIHAALGSSQLDRAREDLYRRKEIAVKYNEAFSDLPITLPYVAEGISHAYHLYVIQVENRKGLYDYLRKNNIYSQVHYVPVHLHPYYRQFGWTYGNFPVAEEYYKHCLSLPMFPSMSYDEQEFVITKVKDYFL